MPRIASCLTVLICGCLFFGRWNGLSAQESPRFSWEPVESGLSVSFRGISAINSEVVWLSGSQGSYAFSLDGGITWTSGKVPHADSLDFRDVHAVDAQIAYLMSAGPGSSSRVYKTTDAGRTWQLQLSNEIPEGFFNGMAFWDARTGLLVSDPVAGRPLIFTTGNGGETWNRLAPEHLPQMHEGEYGFAASGTGVAVFGERLVWLATGGSAARVFRSANRGKSWSVADTPFISGEPSSGIFSIAFRDSLHGVAVGGDYRQPDQSRASVARTVDSGLTWTLIDASEMLGYRSCVAYVPGLATPTWVAVGDTGSDLSLDDGRTWQPIGEVGFHTISFANSSDSGWAAGADGRVARFVAVLSDEYE